MYYLYKSSAGSLYVWKSTEKRDTVKAFRALKIASTASWTSNENWLELNHDERHIHAMNGLVFTSENYEEVCEKALLESL